MSAWRARMDAFFGRGGAAVTLPAMDGPLRPNTALDDATVVARADAPGSLCVIDGAVHYASGPTMFTLDGSPVATFDAPITALASDGDGAIAVGLDDGTILMRKGRAQSVIERGCPTALAFVDGALLVAHGARAHVPSGWQRALMGRDATGWVSRVRAGGAAEVLADGLAWPYGLLAAADGVIVAEAFAHRLRRLGGGVVLDDLPGYPARLRPAPDGGAWLSVFAPRTQLTEFVLREPAYRRRMMAEVDPAYWIAPALVSGRSYLEPLQGGAVKHMATLKPWAPSRSYGLVVRLDARMQPVASYHSRADGAFHGVTDALEWDGALIACSAGGGAVLRVQP